jgi:hypothetical protein
LSRTVDLFLDSDQPLERFASQLSELTGAQLVASPDGTGYYLHDGPVAAFLFEHDYVDDDDLPLSEFRFVFSAQVRGRGRMEDSAELQYLRQVNGRLRETSGMSSLLVIDLQVRDALPFEST